MNEEEKKKLTEEVNKIIQSRFEFIYRNYLLIRDAYKNDYYWPELDPLRDEICLSIMFGLCQAAITLTNHFLESLLKNALIILNGKDKKEKEEDIKGRIITSFMKKYEEGIGLYGNAKLNKTINCACSVGLITKEQKEQLHQFRERFRNAYSHADKTKTFGKSTMPVAGLKFENTEFKLVEKGEPEIANFLIGQGLVQAIMAQNDAPRYFLYIDRLARDIRMRLFGSIDNNSHED
ncbi:MAG: hypothetical protein JXC36_01530 [Candidatus Atribacteria bacterium]|nr:hypothetical protein [Candidatus Atribacteria bacterium]